MFYDIFRCCFFSAEDGLLAFCLSLCGAPGSRAQGVLVLVPCWGVAECGVFARRGGDIHRSVSLEHSFFFFLASRLKTVFTRFFTSYRHTQSQVGSLLKKGGWYYVPHSQAHRLARVSHNPSGQAVMSPIRDQDLCY